MSGGRERLPAAATAELDALWQRVSARGAGNVSRDDLREVATAVSAEACRSALLAEQVIVAVKDSWSAHAEFRRPEERHETRWVLTEVVSLCIREFYRQQRGGTA